MVVDYSKGMDGNFTDVWDSFQTQIKTMNENERDANCSSQIKTI